jgi:hypothetical protein
MARGASPLWWMNLSVAPPAPAGARAFAPNRAIATPFSIHTCFRTPRATQPLLLPFNVLPMTNYVASPFVSPWGTQLIPNPYQPTG